MRNSTLLSRILAVFLLSSLFLSSAAQAEHPGHSEHPKKSEPQRTLATPSAAQLEFSDYELGAFFHIGLNTFTGQEHGDGKEPASKFNPTALDTEQWVLAAKKLGAKYAIMCARHEGGFCLWPTKTTDYSIKNSPYKDGKGDIVREFVDACRKHGIKPCLYHPPYYDSHHVFKPDDEISWGKVWDALTRKYLADEKVLEEFTKMQVTQIKELMTNYGPITYMWFDHWGCPGPGAREFHKKITETVHKFQPNCLVMGYQTATPGNETGHVVYPMWNAVDTKDGTPWTRPKAPTTEEVKPDKYGLLETTVHTGSPYGKYWRLRECPTNNAFAKGGWFWHGRHKVRPLKDHVELYYRTVGLGSNLLINLPPDKRGLVPDDFANAANKMRLEIERRFANPIAQTKGRGNIVELKLPAETEINHVVTMENIANGQKVISYVIEAKIDGQWQKVVENQTIGHKKIDTFAPVKASAVRFRCIESAAKPVEIRSLKVYNVTEPSAKKKLIDIGPVNGEKKQGELVKPSPQQLAFQDLEMGLFIHFSMSTFTGQSHGDGRASAETFNPTEVDCEQWLQVAKSMGAKYACLTTRHEDGLCLWPTKTTEYSIKNTPYKNGKGDIVRQFVDACRKYDIKPCFYHPPLHDAHHIFKPQDNAKWYKPWFESTEKRLSDPQTRKEFTQMQVDQVTELLTNYGPITYLWFDHYAETQGIITFVDEFWSTIVDTVRQLQPDCLILGPEVHLSGGHGGVAQYPLWNAHDNIPTDKMAAQWEQNPLGKYYGVWEANTRFNKRWFWTPENEAMPLDKMMDHYYKTVGRGANFLANYGPDRRGLMPDDVVQRAKEFGDELKRRFEYQIGAAAGTGDVLDVEFGESLIIDHVVIMEDLSDGQKIAKYRIQAYVDNDWKTIAEGQTVGHKRIEQFEPVDTDAIRFECIESVAKPVKIKSLAAYNTQS